MECYFGAIMVPLLPFYLVSLTLGLSLACILTLFFPSCPTIIPALTTYGVSALYLRDKIQFIRAISVPKKWFWHFYLLGSFWAASWLLFCGAVSYDMTAPTDSLKKFLRLFTPIKPQHNWSTTLLASGLVLFHVVRRLWESLCISVYSDTTMNLFHYVVGLIHYTILPLTIVCESKGIADSRYGLVFTTSAISPSQWFGVALFLFCNREQHSISRDIAALRKAPDGLIHNYAHGICYGGWFDYVSCPHFLFEIGIYLSLWMVLPGAYTFKFLVVFVFINQIFAGLITHRWYRRTFKAYPLERKAVIPYIL
ncbi:Polyprenol reductase [Trichostrongylus colubriformis]|uniref:Polyprenal reductase n=1 Tax=Trichostrongylus colubriformis TaxID=6319 RepID=A0AAN8ERM9_TRICO